MLLWPERAVKPLLWTQSLTDGPSYWHFSSPNPAVRTQFPGSYSSGATLSLRLAILPILPAHSPRQPGPSLRRLAGDPHICLYFLRATVDCRV